MAYNVFLEFKVAVTLLTIASESSFLTGNTTCDWHKILFHGISVLKDWLAYSVFVEEYWYKYYNFFIQHVNLKKYLYNNIGKQVVALFHDLSLNIG